MITLTYIEGIIIILCYLIWGFIGTVIGRIHGSYENFLIDLLNNIKGKLK
jgi:hypothetical protein